MSTRLSVLTLLILLAPLRSFAVDVIAHRGYSCLSDENSFASIERAWLAGADGVELDVRVSSDGVAYLFHDDELNSREVNDLTYSEVLALSKSTIPTLQNALAGSAGPGYFVLDLKVDRTSDLAPVIAAVRESGLSEDRVSFQSKHLDVLAALGKGFPMAKLTYLSHLKWRIPYILKPSVNAIVRRLENSGIDRISIKGRSFIDREFVAKLKTGGREVHVWTINDPDRVAFYRDVGVDGVITDNVASATSLVHPAAPGKYNCSESAQKL